MGSTLIVCSAYHKNSNAKLERANGFISDTLRAYSNDSKDHWDLQLPFAALAINNAASALGNGPEPLFIARGSGAHL
jgi:hypothetical protein